MDSNQIIEERVLTRINLEIGNNFKQLHRASLLVDHYNEQINNLAKKLDYKLEINRSIFKSAMQSEMQNLTSIDFELEKIKQLEKQLAIKIKKSKTILMGTSTDLDKYRKLEQLLSYLKILQNIEEINCCLANAISGKDEAKMVNTYLALYENNDCENSIIGRLTIIEAPYLKQFAIRTAEYWHTLLNEKFSKEFEAVLKSIRWGQKDENFMSYSPSNNITKVQLLAEYLLLLKSPKEEIETFESITPCIICRPIGSITKFLLAPYRKRFMYHFTGNRQTNRLDKPEWFYTQILNWGKESHLFVGKTFQPAAVKAGEIDLNIRLEFLRGLVQLTIEKLVMDIEAISRDETLFAHLLDETFAFESELRELFGYPSSFPSAINVITQPIYLLKWISLEERFCAEKMNCILQDGDAWIFINPNVFEDALKIPKCADQFIRLLDAVKDRYCSLIQPGHQLQFLNLQLALIDSFRIRLVQLHSSGLVDTISILNTINYITMVLREWGENVHYLHLHAALVGPNANEYNSVFENCINELEHWTLQLIKQLATKTVNEVKAKSMPYRRDAWSNMPEQNMKEPLMLSPSAGEMLQVLVTVLHNLEDGLSANHFALTLRVIAKQFDAFMFESMILNTKFSVAGAMQFSFDLKRNLFPVFGQYSKRPELLLKRLHDSNLLLNCARGTALLLYEALQNANSMEEKMKIVRELGILHFKPRHCMEVLERRSDIRII